MSNIDAKKAASFFYDEYDRVPTHTMGRSMQFGADWDKAVAVEFLKKAVKIELHPFQNHRLIAWDTPTHCIAFEVDLKKIDAFLSQPESAR